MRVARIPYAPRRHLTVDVTLAPETMLETVAALGAALGVALAGQALLLLIPAAAFAVRWAVILLRRGALSPTALAWSRAVSAAAWLAVFAAIPASGAGLTALVMAGLHVLHVYIWWPRVSS